MQKLIDRIKEDEEEFGAIGGCYESAAIHNYLKNLLDEINRGEVSE